MAASSNIQALHNSKLLPVCYSKMVIVPNNYATYAVLHMASTIRHAQKDTEHGIAATI
jgi:hypothetical protein